jgi:NADPH:quinone reductase
MRAAWYERQGPAAEVLQVGEMPIPETGPDEVRVRVTASGISSGDLGKRRGWSGAEMAFPRVIAHGDGAGVIDAVGDAVDRSRFGERVWVYLAQSYRPFGTAAEYTVVPARHAVPLPASVAFEQAAGLGIPGITAHRAIFADGPVAGQNVVVTGAVGQSVELRSPWRGAAAPASSPRCGDPRRSRRRWPLVPTRSSTQPPEG